MSMNEERQLCLPGPHLAEYDAAAAVADAHDAEQEAGVLAGDAEQDGPVGGEGEGGIDGDVEEEVGDEQDDHGGRAEDLPVGDEQLEEPAKVLLRVEAATAAGGGLVVPGALVQALAQLLLLQVVGVAILHLE